MINISLNNIAFLTLAAAALLFLLLLVWIMIEIRVYYQDEKWKRDYNRHLQVAKLPPPFPPPRVGMPPVKEDEFNADKHPMIRSIIDHLRSDHRA